MCYVYMVGRLIQCAHCYAYLAVVPIHRKPQGDTKLCLRSSHIQFLVLIFGTFSSFLIRFSKLQSARKRLNSPTDDVNAHFLSLPLVLLHKP
jgi:hypothetical protein